MSLIEDGIGNAYKAEVNRNHELVVKAITEEDIDHVAEKYGETYLIQAIDAGPTAAEYTLYFKNTGEKDFIIKHIFSYVTDTDVEWILTTVTGTAATASVIVPVNSNLGSGKTADVLCRGGAGGVSGLTPVKTIWTIKGGPVFNEKRVPVHIVIPKDIAVAFEYNAGTGGSVQIGLHGYYNQDK